MTIYKGTVPIAGLAKNTIVNGFHIFDCKWADHLLEDISWLRADQFSYHSGSVYVTAYNELVSEYNNASSTTETEGSITFKRTPKGYKIADATQEANILAKYNTDGIAWYYILDTTNTQFKLPRTKFGFEGLRTNVGNDIAESLPNIKGRIEDIRSSGGGSVSSSGSLVWISNNLAWRNNVSEANVGAGGLNLDASRSSSTYQDNAPVQERATQMYLYFYVGEYAQTAIEQTAGITSEQLNAKVDVASLSTINPMIVSYVDPDTPTNGYNIWANGYCEQWGSNGGQVVGTVTTVNLVKTFANTNYIIKATGYTASSSAGGYTVGYYDKTTSSFKLRGPGNGNTSQNSWDWVACGYLAEGEY